MSPVLFVAAGAAGAGAEAEAEAVLGAAAAAAVGAIAEEPGAEATAAGICCCCAGGTAGGGTAGRVEAVGIAVAVGAVGAEGRDNAPSSSDTTFPLCWNDMRMPLAFCQRTDCTYLSGGLAKQKGG